MEKPVLKVTRELSAFHLQCVDAILAAGTGVLGSQKKKKSCS